MAAPMNEWLLLAALAAGLLVNGTLQILACRTGRAGWMASFFLGFAAGLGVATAGVLLVALPAGAQASDALALLATVAISYGACGFFYFNIVNGRKSALRVRLLRELRESPGGLTAADVLQRYPPGEMFATRLGRMIAHRQAVETDGRLHVRHGAVWLIMKVMTAMKLLLFGAPSEFDLRDRGGS